MEKTTTGLPVKQDLLLEAGVHIGTRIKTSDMAEFIFKKRDDGLYILDLRKTAEKLMAAAKLLARYSPEDVLIVASRVYSSNSAVKFSKLTGIPVLRGRFVPGTMTNLVSKQFKEPKLVLVCDPKGEREAILESAKNGVPVIALCDTDNETKFVDIVIPINNKGRRSLALVFYVLARELMMSQEKIKSYDDFQYDIRYFEKLEFAEEGAEEAAEQPAEEAPEEKKEEKPEKKPEKEEKPKEVKEKKPKKKGKPKKEEKKEEKPAEAPKEEKKEEKPTEEKKPEKEEPKKEEKLKEEKEEKKETKKKKSSKKED